MKKLVIFTLAMVLVAGVALAAERGNNDPLLSANNNVVPVAVSDDDANAAAAKGNVAQQAFQVNTDLKTGDILSNNRKTEDSYNQGVSNNDVDEDAQVGYFNAKNKGQAGLANAKDNGQATVTGSNYKASGGNAGVNNGNSYIVDNAILANVNVQGVEVGLGVDTLQAASLRSDGRNKEQDPGVEQKNSFEKKQTSQINYSFTGSNGVANMNSAAGNMQTQSAATSIGVVFVK